MSVKSNQEIERYYFDCFRRAYLLPDGEISHCDKPDVIIIGQRKVGIEVTNFFLQGGELPESEQNQSRIREQILEEAQRRFIDQGGKLIEISFSFASENPIKKKGKLIQEIIALAKQVEARETGEVPQCVYMNIPEICYMYVNAELYPDPKWRAFQIYTVPIMSVERLATIVKEKEKKVKEYAPCEAYWLLVVVDFINPAQDQEILVEDIRLASNVFEKIIIYKTVFDQVVEVTCK